MTRALPPMPVVGDDNGCVDLGIAPPFQDPSPTMSAMEVAVEQGQHYRIEVDAQTTTQGSFRLAWSMPASNDSYIEARGIGGAPERGRDDPQQRVVRLDARDL